jgi:hypothetical protein
MVEKVFNWIKRYEVEWLEPVLRILVEDNKLEKEI